MPKQLYISEGFMRLFGEVVVVDIEDIPLHLDPMIPGVACYTRHAN